VPNGDFDADDLIGVSVVALPADGSVNITIADRGPMVGSYSINYMVS